MITKYFLFFENEKALQSKNSTIFKVEKSMKTNFSVKNLLASVVLLSSTALMASTHEEENFPQGKGNSNKGEENFSNGKRYYNNEQANISNGERNSDNREGNMSNGERNSNKGENHLNKNMDHKKMDAVIESSATNSYVFRNYLKDDDIHVKSEKCVVTLTGTAENQSHKNLAQETVENLQNVQRVENKIVVNGDEPDEKSDLWLVTKLKTTLLFHRHVSSLTEVTSNDGVVTLRGVADSQAEKDLTTEYARDIDGVRDVKNEMTVALSKVAKPTVGEMIDDASITAQVKTALLSHRSTSAIGTKVSTKEGVVTLRGYANNDAEIKLVSKLAENIRGVVSVNNLMTVEET